MKKFIKSFSNRHGLKQVEMLKSIALAAICEIDSYSASNLNK